VCKLGLILFGLIDFIISLNLFLRFVSDYLEFQRFVAASSLGLGSSGHVCFITMLPLCLYFGLLAVVGVNKLSVTLCRTPLLDRPATVMPQRGFTTTEASSSQECLCLTFITYRSRLQIRQSRRTSAGVHIAFLLLLVGVESNPGPTAASLKLGVINVQSAVHKASLLRDVIFDHRIDLLVATETWMKASQPAAVTQDIAPTGFQVLHRFRRDNIAGGGVALVYADFLQVFEVPITSTISSADCLVTKV